LFLASLLKSLRNERVDQSTDPRVHGSVHPLMATWPDAQRGIAKRGQVNLML
jgi:hypothetical protein